MRVHSIDLVNFLAFTGTVSVDFDEVSQDGLFMLYGLTGSGKTSILDGICYAFYGRSPRIDKTKGLSQLRSQYAKEDDATRVVLEFSIDGIRYRVNRTLAQKREVGVDVKTACVVDRWDGTSWENVHHSVRDSNQFLANLIGLTAEQFFQIVLLPQGKFREFLDAKTSDKEEILKRLFGADRLKVVEEWFKSQAAAAKNATQSAETNLRLAAVQIDSSAKDDSVKISSFKPKWAEAARTELAKEIAQAQTALEAAETMYAAAKTAFEAIAAVADKFNKQKAAKLAFENATAALNNLTSEIQEAGFDVAAPAAELAVAISQQIAALEARIQEIDSALAANQEHNRLSLEIAKVEEEVTAKTNLAETLKAAVEKLQAEKLQLSETQKAGVEASGLLESARNNYELAKSRLDKFSELEKASTKLIDTQKELEKLRSDAEKLQSHHEQLVEQREKSLAAELAQSLQAGDACAVCGSLEHPHPAQVEGELVSREEVDAANLKVQQAQQAVTLKTAELSQIQEQIDSLAEVSNLDSATLVSEAKDLEKNLEALESRVKLGNSATTRSLEIDGSISGATAELNGHTSAITALEQSKAELVTKRAQLVLNTAEAELTAEMESTKLKLSQAVNGNWVTEVTTKTQSLSNAQHELSLLGDRIEFDEADFANLQSQLKQRESDRTAAQATLKKLQESETRLDGLITAFLEKLADYEKANARYREISSLSRLISGNSQQREVRKVSLQAYYLAAKLDEVLMLANQRLGTMTGERFSMMRNPTTGGAGQNHLDIYVLDAWTGQTRPAITGVSGGESFLMSMSLALGLADAIVSGAGVQPFESLFIDEGFGTLDPETLETVMDTLFDLQAGARVVGVISHVKEMAERIPRQIHVKKLAGGSKVEIRTMDVV